MKEYYIAPSTIHGHGIFSKKYFTAGEYIGKCLKPVFKSEIKSDKMYGYSDISYRLGTVVQKTKLEKYLNHSPKPNAELFFYNGLQLHLKAIKNIAEGEEIVVDYGDAFPKIDKLQQMLVDSGFKQT